jgi:hypothetical protein
MFVLLTNASQGFEGLAVAINFNNIVSVFESKNAETGEVSTVVYSNDNNWVVKETVAEVVEKLSI